MASMITEQLYVCKVCDQEGLTVEKLRSHLQQTHLKVTSVCPFCAHTDLTSDDMTDHVLSDHLNDLGYHKENGSDFHKETGEKSYQNEIKLNHIPVVSLDDSEEIMVKSQGFLEDKHDNIVSEPQFSLNVRETVTISPQKKDICPNTNKSANIESVMHCPICCVSKKSPFELEEHMNRSHFDLESKSDEIEKFSCLFCSRSFQSASYLEIHINIDHDDILSPRKTQLPIRNDKHSEVGMCPVCSRSEFPSFSELALHIDTHFMRRDCSDEQILESEKERNRNKERKIEQHEFSLLKKQYGMDNEGNFSQQSVSNMQKAVYSGKLSIADYYEHNIELKASEYSGIDDGRSCTKGLLGSIRTACESSYNVKAAWLCTAVNHYSSTYGDRGWGCGCRNVQMLLSCLHHEASIYRDLFLNPGQMPSVTQIQKLIESAWKSGFDKQGCEQLGGQLLNSRKWIGATEVVSLLASVRIRCQLIDCHRPTGPNETHPELFQLCLDYFSKPADFKPPIYLQHQGHSRTVIGVEESANGSPPQLLIFDPSTPSTKISQIANSKTATSAMRLIRKNLQNMKAKQYQMVIVTGRTKTEQEYNQSKVLQSIRIPKE